MSIKYIKKVGETPLEMLDRVRKEFPKLKEEKLSYAGRLDPMAEGEMLVLVGEENKKAREHFKYDKEYIATFIIGTQTDTGDALGKIINKDLNPQNKEVIQKQIKNLKDIKSQTYPWFSGQTVDGIKLFDHFKSSNTNIERPSQKIEIKEVEFISLKEEPTTDILDYINKTIKKVRGDFRQGEILSDWQNFSQIAPEKIQVFEIKITVSSGTYIRGLTENFSFPVTLLKLIRTKIFD